MKTFVKILKDFPWFLWSGWGSISSVCLFFALWDFGNKYYGDMVLPSPLLTFVTLKELFLDGGFKEDLYLTVFRALKGFGVSLVIGSILGLLAGFFKTASIFSRPIVTILVGVPPIAWIVMAMIWFGFGNGTIAFTVIIASFPIVFAGAMQGSRTIEGKYKEVCDVFKLKWHQKITNLYIPHLISYFFPSYISALGIAWKVVVMAELLGASDGIGVRLGIARSYLDTPTALALVCSMVIVLLFIEYVILEPVKKEVEQWRS
ncbi:MAG: ABC transporter permease subunit [Campylobacteraceae bacterium]|jgi:NitT/TauT family transport system permease protein|nr:ABC transporter permease subunit [Campylobacteraceae bacterium]